MKAEDAVYLGGLRLEGSRAMKRFGMSLFLPAVVSVLAISGCSSGSSSSGTSADRTTIESTPASAPPSSSVDVSTTTPAVAPTSSSPSISAESTTVPAPTTVPASNRLNASDVQALITGDLASAPWAASILSMSDTTLLRRPVVAIEMTDQTAMSDAMNGLQTALLTSEKWGVIEVYDPTYAYFVSIGSLDLFDPIDLPTPPASAEEVLPWLNQAFGVNSPAPENWVAHVTSAEYAATVPSGYTNAVVIGTDLPWGTGGNPAAQVIAQAIYAAEPTFATTFVIHYSEADYQYSGDIVTQMGQFGYWFR